MAARNPRHPNDVEKGLGLGTFRQLPRIAGLPLDELGKALSVMLDSGETPYDPGISASQPAPDHSAQLKATTEETKADDACEITPRSILEAILFVGGAKNEPLTSKQVAGLMRGVRPAEIDALVRELNRQYESRNCPYTIVAEGAGYRLVLREEHAAVRDRFHGKARQTRLSQSAVEVLAAVAYHQPITADEVNKLRATPSGQVLAQLVRRQLLRIERADSQRRTIRYRTTPRFLTLFGLESLADLPRGDDLEEP